MNQDNAIDEYSTTQAMIDINTGHLDGLRTYCDLAEELTQAEIRSIETKLIKLFGKQLIDRKISLTKDENIVPFPELKKWLYVVGLSDNTQNKIVDQIDNNFENLFNFTEDDLKQLMENYSSEESRRLLTAMKNLKLFILKSSLDNSIVNELDFHWDSWDHSFVNAIKNEKILSNNSNNKNQNTYDDKISKSSSHSSPSSKTKNYNSQQHYNDNYQTIHKLKDRKGTPPSTPPIIMKNKVNNYLLNNKDKLSTTPPPSKKYLKNMFVDANSLTKSKSHEEHLSHKIEQKDLNKISDINKFNQRGRIATEPGLGDKSPVVFSPNRSSPVNLSDNQQNDSCFDEPSNSTNYVTVPPRSPRSRGGMMHSIHHRFASVIKLSTVICHLCEKPLRFGVKCKECKYICHRECMNKVPPSCGLPKELVNIFKETLNKRTNSDTPTKISIGNSNSHYSYSNSVHQNQHHAIKKKNFSDKNIKSKNYFFALPDSSSNASSCNSSASSSPALIVQDNQHKNSSFTPKKSTFDFPDVNKQNNQADNFKNNQNLNYQTVDTQQSLNLAKLFDNNSGSTDSDKTLVNRLGSQDSQISDFDQSDRPWPRQNSLTMKEWDIPFDELKKEKEIGTGRFGTVYKGNWHGSVAIKMFNVANGLDEKKAFEAFKLEVATFRKTRHENLVLFMGACMKPPHLAIVTSYCKGLPLYNHIHERKEKFNLNRIIGIGLQISQGMGYLHARGIIHKDLKSKNIFYDSKNNKIIITDFGLFSLAKLCFSNNENNDQIQIPKEWLCYLAPELIKALKAGNDQDQDDLPFSFSTDVFSFGTIWHELIFGFLPFKGKSAEVIIWQVGKGIKQSLVNLQASKEIKEILMVCWAYKPSERPDFSKLVDILKNLPKKRLQRSPSHPTHLLRSLESLF